MITRYLMWNLLQMGCKYITTNVPIINTIKYYFIICLEYNNSCCTVTTDIYFIYIYYDDKWQLMPISKYLKDESDYDESHCQ